MAWALRGNIRGPTGPQGIQGPTGSIGPIGPEGPTGPVGPRGATWFTGTGTPSAPGDLENDLYLDGVTGTVWIWDGSSWVNAMSILGPVGPIGLTGSDGQQGIQGVQGPKGETGDTGPRGFQGVQGPAGAAATITVGATTTGPPGSDAAVIPSGTQENRVLSFTVPRGAIGPQGDDGPQGIQGPGGAKGDDGDRGPAGTPGVQGIQGPPGPTGDTGPVGPPGDPEDLAPIAFSGSASDLGAGTVPNIRLPGRLQAGAQSVNATVTLNATYDSGLYRVGSIASPTGNAASLVVAGSRTGASAALSQLLIDAVTGELLTRVWDFALVPAAWSQWQRVSLKAPAAQWATEAGDSIVTEDGHQIVWDDPHRVSPIGGD